MSTKTAKKITTQQKSLKVKNVEETAEVFNEDSTKKSFTKFTELTKNFQQNRKIVKLEYLPIETFERSKLNFERVNFNEQNKKNQESITIGKMKVMPKINSVWVNYDNHRLSFKAENIIPVSRVMYLEDAEENSNIKFNLSFDPEQEQTLKLREYFKTVDEELKEFCEGKNNFLKEQGLDPKQYKSWSESDVYNMDSIEIGNPRTYPRKSVGFAKSFHLAIYSLDPHGNQTVLFKPQEVEGSLDIFKMINDNCKPRRSMFSVCLQLPSVSFVKGNKKYSPKHIITNLTIFTCEGPARKVEEVVEFKPNVNVLRKLGIHAEKIEEVSTDETKESSDSDAEEESEEEVEVEESEEESEEDVPKKTLTKKN
jgi:hypothetical protein